MSPIYRRDVALPDVPVEPLSWGRVKALFVR